MFRWQYGRQGTGYSKLLFFSSERFKFDVYLLKYPEGSSTSWHRDKVKEGKHHRLNLVVRKAEGGRFLVQLPTDYAEDAGMVFLSGRLNYFRPDVLSHKVTKIIKGTRYVLSIGWVTK